MKINRMAILDKKSGTTLKTFEEELRNPQDGEIQIDVQIAGVAFGDIIRGTNSVMKIKEFPFSPGYDVAGTVTAVGSGVSGFTEGDRVCAYTETGGYATAVNISAERVRKLPSGVSFENGAAVMLNYITAYQMFNRVTTLQKGDTILIHSAAGGVGTAVLDLGRRMGLKMYGTCSSGKKELVESYGAVAIDYRNEDFVEVIKKLEPSGLKAVFEAQGPENARRSRQVVSGNGTLVLFGYVGTFSGSSRPSPFRFMRNMINVLLFRKGVNTVLYAINPQKKPDWFAEDVDALLKLLADGEIHPLIHEVLPLARANEAQQLLLERKVRGKVLLDCR